ncbi:uncharacterized protein ARMOST_10392 [Armillaria ostoyae]|uniref:Uncharacterized protein n=1 Tax=Armillaria ostoyae TaxID=47428 RepID=A0A284RE61_ARMOS|nr:uncharacterized protein ARMOST_10392 [Armillaria ostoyae]
MNVLSAHESKRSPAMKHLFAVPSDSERLYHATTLVVSDDSESLTYTLDRHPSAIHPITTLANSTRLLLPDPPSSRPYTRSLLPEFVPSACPSARTPPFHPYSLRRLPRRHDHRRTVCHDDNDRVGGSTFSVQIGDWSRNLE